NGDDFGYGVNIESDGKILVAACANSAYVINQPNGDYALVRYTKNGFLDNSFGKHGIVMTDFSGFQDNPFSTVLQPDGKLILAGRSSDGSKYRISLSRYERNALINSNAIQGATFFDRNLNSTKDVDEPFFDQLNIVASKAGFDTVSTIASNGNFSVDIDTGLYVTKAIPYLPYYNVVPATHNTSFNSYFNIDTVSFAVQPIAGKRDLSINLVPLTVSRPGFATNYKILYRNNGTDTISNGSIEFIKNSKINYISSSPSASSVTGDTLRWSFSNLKPQDTAGIVINLSVKSPPSVNIGDTLATRANIYPVTTDLTPNDNTSVFVQRAIGSFDPNDKTENHPGSIKAIQVTNGEYLQYTIRFQNTGTDTAFNVYVRDTLSSKLDWSSFQMLAASHNYQLTINDGAKCSWAFNNINLADSNKNEGASHGYIVYRIKPKSSVSFKDTIYNSAAIYFDYNLPVHTNAEKTYVVSGALPVKLISFTAKREEKINRLNWNTAHEINVSHFVIERSANGRVFEGIGKVNAGITNYDFADLKPEKAINYYRLKIVDKDGRFEFSPVRTVNNIGSFDISIYPNPAKERLILQLESEKETGLQLQIFSLDAKVLMTRQLTAPIGSVIKTIDIASLRSGSYYLNVISKDKEQMVIKFEKL
ncbi:MAG: hypothetical protein JWQ09_1671, partial [Segetibacter sp.]|nr:hypothetical protein [Segetibacter sp.]